MTAAYAYDLFITYADVDGEWVESYLMPQTGLNTERILTKKLFQLGAFQVSEFERAVISSQFTVVVLVLHLLLMNGQNSQKTWLHSRVCDGVRIASSRCCCTT